MAQTTGAINGLATVLSLKVGAGSYVDISGSSQSVDPPSSEFGIGEANTWGASTAILTTGNFVPQDVKVNILYTETASEAFLLAVDAHENRTAVQLKWVPAGSGGIEYETNAGGYIKAIVLPVGDATSSGPLMASFTIRCNGFTRTTP